MGVAGENHDDDAFLHFLANEPPQSSASVPHCHPKNAIDNDHMYSSIYALYPFDAAGFHIIWCAMEGLQNTYSTKKWWY